MPRVKIYTATATVAVGMILGCSSSKPTGLSSAKPASSMSFSSITEGAKKTTSSITSAIGSGFKKSTEALKPRPKVIPASDPIALGGKTPQATPQLLVSMATMQEQSGSFDQAEELFNRALQLDEKNLEATLGLAHLYDRQGEFEKATLRYLQAAKQHPKAPAVHNDLALCYARRGMFDESAASLRTAIRLKPEKKLFRNNLATVLTEQGQLDEALAQLTHAHGPAAAHYNLGYLLHQRGNDAQAAVHFAAALRADPAMTQAQTWLAELQPQAPASQPAPTKNLSPQIAVSPEGPQIEAPTGLPEVSIEPEVTTENETPDVATPVAGQKTLPPHVSLENPDVVRSSEGEAVAPQPSQAPTYLQPQARTDSRYESAPPTAPSRASGRKEEVPSRYSGYYSAEENENAPLPTAINRYRATATPLPKVQDASVSGRGY